MAFATIVAFAIFAGIILVGFLGELIFRRYGIPSVLLLLATGYLLGPVTGIVDVETMLGLEYIFAPLALLILLFDGGTQLNIYRLVHESGRGIILGVLGLGLAIGAVATVWALMGNSLFSGVILGAVVAGTGSAIVIPIARGMKISEKARQTITIESSITDVVAVVLVLSLTGAFISGHASIQGTTQSVVSSFSIGAVLGVIFGMAWIGLSPKLRKLNFFYMLTLAIMLVLYIITEITGGSGAIAALVFGFMLGNMGEIGKMLKFEGVAEEPGVSKFQNEISFLVRTFFFVFLGTIVNITDVGLVLVGIGITLLLLAVRAAAVWVSTWKSDLLEFRPQLTVLMPRGLATAIMATYPAAMLLEKSSLLEAGEFNMLYKMFSSFPQIAFVVIIASILATTVGAVMFGNGKPAKKEEEAGEEGMREAAKKPKKKKKVEIQKTVVEEDEKAE